MQCQTDKESEKKTIPVTKLCASIVCAGMWKSSYGSVQLSMELASVQVGMKITRFVNDKVSHNRNTFHCSR